MSERHPLQPEWGGGTHLDRFARVRPYLEHQRVLDVGAGSGVNRPDWMHARIASVRTHQLSVHRLDALEARWSLLAGFAAATGHDDVAEHANDVLACIRGRREDA